jgi:integrase
VGTVFKPTTYKDIPAEAEIVTRKGERFACWKDKRGSARKVKIVTVAKGERAGQDRLEVVSRTWFARYRDGAGLVQIVPTSCRDETAARGFLAELERRAELVKAGVMTCAESRIANHQETALALHFDAYDASMNAKGVSAIHRTYTRRYLDRLARECPLTRLDDITRETAERWLNARAAAGVGAKARNAYRGALLAFCNWCLETDRLAVNPVAKVAKANEKADRRRQRRAMTEGELTRLLEVARQRPLLEALTVRKGPRKGERYADVRPAVRDRLDALGRERALIYKTLVLTGLRKGELASLTVGQLFLDGPSPYAALDAGDEKNRQGNGIVLRDDLAVDLGQWLAFRLECVQSEARRLGGPIPARLPADVPLFEVPAGLLRILNRDLALAGIAKADDRGRTLDVHALRTTFGTLLSKGGVAPRTAQAAMRHSDPRLTMNVYTDPRLLDVKGALDVLPALPLYAEPLAIPAAAKATGTTGAGAFQSILPTMQNADKPLQIVSNADKMNSSGLIGESKGRIDATSTPVKSKEPLTSSVSGSLMSGRKDLNLRPHGPEPCALAKLSYAPYFPC